MARRTIMVVDQQQGETPGSATLASGLQGVAAGFDEDGCLRVVSAAGDLDLMHRRELARALMDAAAGLLGGTLRDVTH